MAKGTKKRLNCPNFSIAEALNFATEKVITTSSVSTALFSSGPNRLSFARACLIYSLRTSAPAEPHNTGSGREAGDGPPDREPYMLSMHIHMLQDGLLRISELEEVGLHDQVISQINRAIAGDVRNCVSAIPVNLQHREVQDINPVRAVNIST